MMNLEDAKQYIFDRLRGIEGEELSETEQSLIALEFEERFFAKIEGVVREEEFAQMRAQTPQELDAKLFYLLPNYVNLVEETVQEFMVEYLS